MMLCFSSSLHCSSQRNPDVLSAGQVKLDEDALRTWNAAFPVTHLRVMCQMKLLICFPFFGSCLVGYLQIDGALSTGLRI